MVPDHNMPNSLAGQFLIAMPQMADTRFAHSVVYLCAHSDEGAMGIVLNQKTPSLSFPDLLRQSNCTLYSLSQ